jgi:predicted lysophospholipase L1 biosynthesis ABC-type transport system permease subunit
MPLRRGRAIGPDDVVGLPDVAMVNEAFVKRYMPGVSPLGRHFSYNGRQFEIVGEIGDAQFQSARDPLIPMVFVAMLQEPTGMVLDCEMDVRTRGNAESMIAAVRDAIGSVDSRVRIQHTDTFRAQVLARFAPERTAAGFIVTFAIAALLVASIGLYGVVSYGLARRTNELAVRIALGAARGDIVRLVARDTIVRLAAGLALGAALAEFASSLIAGQLFGVTPRDPLSLFAAAAILTIVCALALARPLVRALQIDPIVALKQE